MSQMKSFKNVCVWCVLRVWGRGERARAFGLGIGAGGSWKWVGYSARGSPESGECLWRRRRNYRSLVQFQLSRQSSLLPHRWSASVDYEHDVDWVSFVVPYMQRSLRDSRYLTQLSLFLPFDRCASDMNSQFLQSHFRVTAPRSSALLKPRYRHR